MLTECCLTLLAARQGDVETLKIQLAEKVLNSDVKDVLGATPVHHAARAGKLTCLRYLVEEAGLPANSLARNGASPAHDAAATGNLTCLHWLLLHGGEIMTDSWGGTPLHDAAENGELEVCECFSHLSCLALQLEHLKHITGKLY
uniref:Uncharacterized protein n=1 Tax=Cyprinus carpio TaxID=7962 RepID=A0A8C2C3J9_CYPCA